jgi:transcriptional regulator with XRE-family HTH domain
MTPKQFNRSLGAVTRQLRIERGLSQAHVGVALGVTYQQIQKNEHGQNSLAAHYLPKLAKLFGVTVADLYERAGVKSVAAEPTAADNDAFMAARYVKRIADPKLRSHIIDFTRKLAYEGACV